MKSLLNSLFNTEILERIEKIRTDDAALWGEMSAHQMLVHCTDQLRMSFGEISSAYRGTLMSSTLVKILVLLGIPIPKGKIKTTDELKQGVGGSQLTSFGEDKKILTELVTNFDSKYGARGFRKHPSFGDLNKHQWGRLAYLHLDHHLKQFGR